MEEKMSDEERNMKREGGNEWENEQMSKCVNKWIDKIDHFKRIMMKEDEIIK